MPGPNRHAATVEILTMSGLIASYMWAWQFWVPGGFVLCVALYAGIGIRGHRRAGESAHDIGLRFDNLLPALGLIVLWVGPLALLALAVGWGLGTLHFPPMSEWPALLARGTLWGTAQQYGLLAFYYRRYAELAGGRAATLAAAATFAMFHLPNPLLTGVTLVAGALAVWLYRRVPNLLAIGFFHAVLSMTLSASLPDWITYRNKVGPGFIRAWQEIHQTVALLF